MQLKNIAFSVVSLIFFSNTARLVSSDDNIHVKVSSDEKRFLNNSFQQPPTPRSNKRTSQYRESPCFVAQSSTLPFGTSAPSIKVPSSQRPTVSSQLKKNPTVPGTQTSTTTNTTTIVLGRPREIPGENSTSTQPRQQTKVPASSCSGVLGIISQEGFGDRVKTLREAFEKEKQRLAQEQGDPLRLVNTTTITSTTSSIASTGTTAIATTNQSRSCDNDALYDTGGDENQATLAVTVETFGAAEQPILRVASGKTEPDQQLLFPKRIFSDKKPKTVTRDTSRDTPQPKADTAAPSQENNAIQPDSLKRTGDCTNLASTFENADHDPRGVKPADIQQGNTQPSVTQNKSPKKQAAAQQHNQGSTQQDQNHADSTAASSSKSPDVRVGASPSIPSTTKSNFRAIAFEPLVLGGGLRSLSYVAQQQGLLSEQHALISGAAAANATTLLLHTQDNSEKGICSLLAKLVLSNGAYFAPELQKIFKSLVPCGIFIFWEKRKRA